MKITTSDMAAINSEALGELNSAETRTLFDTADQLSSLGVGRIVDLPQIIVVGDQSSGKSSVLEAISHVRFPIQGGVCTRFATELVLRTSARSSIAATVHFANGTSPAQTLHTAGFDQEDLGGIIQEAKEKMGITGAAGGGFSKDVLRLEIEGPNLYPLTLVDLPGIFHAETAKQTVEGKATVLELVQSYMRKPNSIILAIISANNQLANQAVMQLATKYDPHRTRTLGVITKPDLLPPKSANETEYLQLIRGRDPVYSLALGWHVLRNRADYETEEASRESIEEQFFRTGSWASISKANRGVASLREKLSRVLLNHIKKGLPLLLDNLEGILSDRQSDLRRLGNPRGSPQDMRSYLIDIAGTFERLVRDGIQGRYNSPFYRDLDGQDPRLRAQLRNFSKAFRFVLLTYGSSQEAIERPGRIDLGPPEAPRYLKDFMNMHEYTLGLRHPPTVTWADLTSQLEQEAAFHQGTELPGFVNMDVVNKFFQDRAKPWQSIAERHLQKVLSVTKAFVEALFERIVGSFSSTSTTRAILVNLVDEYFNTKEQLLAIKLKELLRPYQRGYALPLDFDFHQTMEHRTRASKGPALYDDSDTSESEEDGDSEFGVERIIDTVDTFYDMALRTFTENVVNLAVESCLVQDLPNIFTPKQVSNMEESMLRKLAAESPEVCEHRAQLEEDVRLLKEGLERCRPYRPRARLGGPAPSQTGQIARPDTQTTSSSVSNQHKTPSARQSPQTGANVSLVSNQPLPGAGLFGSSLFPSSTSTLTTGQTPSSMDKPRTIFNTDKSLFTTSSNERLLNFWPPQPEAAPAATRSDGLPSTPAPSGGLFGGKPAPPFPSGGLFGGGKPSTTVPLNGSFGSGTASPSA